MEATRDENWLRGEARWYPRLESTESNLAGEVGPPESWDMAAADIDTRGWARQRLAPLGPRILVPLAMAPLFLVMTAIPLAFPGRTADDQSVAMSLFIFCWILTLVPFSRLSDGLSNRARQGSLDTYPLALIPFTAGLVFFAAHIGIDTRLGWLSYAFFWYAWFLTTRNITDSVSHSTARWLLPINSEDIAREIFADGWTRSHISFRNGPLATWDSPLPDYAADLIGVSRDDDRFVAFTLKHRGGTLHDPFSESLTTDPRFAALFANPPLTISGEAWPARYRVSSEEE